MPRLRSFSEYIHTEYLDRLYTRCVWLFLARLDTLKIHWLERFQRLVHPCQLPRSKPVISLQKAPALPETRFCFAPSKKRHVHSFKTRRAPETRSRTAMGPFSASIPPLLFLEPPYRSAVWIILIQLEWSNKEIRNNCSSNHIRRAADE